jgi:hypothetical protein
LSKPRYNGRVDSAQDWTLEQDRQLTSWAPEIVALLRPDWQAVNDGADIKYIGSGGLKIHRGRGCWYWFGGKNKGGISLLPALQEPELKGFSRAEAITWARAFLSSHPGTGPCTVVDADGDIDGAENAAAAATGKDILERATAATETANVTAYLRSRGLLPPYPGSVLFCENVRIGEDGLVVPLRAHDTTVGVHLVYLDTEGRKSLIEPRKRTYMIEQDKQRRAAGRFEHVPDDLDPALPILVCEGPENWLSLIQAFPRHRIVGMPGIHVLAHIVVSKDAKYLVFRDGDAPGSPADKGLIRGVDHLLLEGASEIRVTPTPAGEDANSILQRDGAAGLQALYDQALGADTKPAELSPEGDIKRLARMKDKPLEFEKERKPVAKKHGIRVDVLQKEVEKERLSLEVPETLKKPSLVRHEPIPYDGEVSLKETLDAADARIKRHVVCTEEQRTIIVLWPAFTHVHMYFPYLPRLAVSSPQPECGKTTTLELVALLSYRVVDSDDINAANLQRMKEAYGDVTLVLDEITEAIEKSDELNTILRSGFKRGARAIRLIKDNAGNLVHEEYLVDMPVAVAGLATLRGALSSRCLHIRLQPKSADKEVEDAWEESVAAELLELCGKLARWAQDAGSTLNLHPHYPPQLKGRQRHCCQALLSIAEAAGPEWAARARAAVVALLQDSADFNEVAGQVLLRDIRAILTALSQATEISSKELVTRLHAVAESGWDGSEGARPLSQHRLARLLRPYNIIPLMIGPETKRVKGYLRSQFLRVEAADLPSSPESPDQTAQTSQPEDFHWVTPDQTSQQTSQATVHTSQSTRQSSQPARHSQPTSQPTAAEAADFPQTVRSERSDHGSAEKAAEAAVGSAPGQEISFGDGLDHAAEGGFLLTVLASYRREHPDWPAKKLAKLVGQPLVRIQALLAQLEPPAETPA